MKLFKTIFNFQKKNNVEMSVNHLDDRLPSIISLSNKILCTRISNRVVINNQELEKIICSTFSSIFLCGLSKIENQYCTNLILISIYTIDTKNKSVFS
jgi:hypothetical protein